MIPEDSTPIKHLILIEILAQGRLSYDEIRIASFIMRWSWGFDGGVRRQDWTKEFTITEIAKEIKMNRGKCSSIINRMIKDGKLLKDGNKFQFNEHYENWKVLQKVTPVTKSNTPVTKSNTSVTKSNTPVTKSNTSVTKSNTPDIQETSIAKASEGKNPHHKDTLKILKDKDTLKILKDKDTLKETIYIFNLWNSLKIIQHKNINKIKSKIIAALKVYTIKELESAIRNYAYVFSNRDKFYWTYKWQLKDFLDNGVDRFLPVNFKESDYFKRVYKSKAELEEERSLGILSRVFREEEEKENDKKGNDSNPNSPEGSI